MRACSFHRHTCMRAFPLHKHALKHAYPSFRCMWMRACSTHRGAFMRPYHKHRCTLKRAYPIHSRAHMRNCATNRCVHSVHLCPPYRSPHVCLSSGKTCTCVCILPDCSSTWGPIPIKPPVQPSVQPLPKNGNRNSMQDDQTTHLNLIGPRSDASFSRNLQISSE
jgi:hypothetical protein